MGAYRAFDDAPLPAVVDAAGGAVRVHPHKRWPTILRKKFEDVREARVERARRER
jgi:hypothetical protein